LKARKIGREPQWIIFSDLLQVIRSLQKANDMNLDEDDLIRILQEQYLLLAELLKTSTLKIENDLLRNSQKGLDISEI
jgi:hypothetical protein